MPKGSKKGSTQKSHSTKSAKKPKEERITYDEICNELDGNSENNFKWWLRCASEKCNIRSDDVFGAFEPASHEIIGKFPNVSFTIENVKDIDKEWQKILGVIREKHNGNNDWDNQVNMMERIINTMYNLFGVARPVSSGSPAPKQKEVKQVGTRGQSFPTITLGQIRNKLDDELCSEFDKYIETTIEDITGKKLILHTNNGRDSIGRVIEKKVKQCKNPNTESDNISLTYEEIKAIDEDWRNSRPLVLNNTGIPSFWQNVIDNMDKIINVMYRLINGKINENPSLGDDRNTYIAINTLDEHKEAKEEVKLPKEQSEPNSLSLGSNGTLAFPDGKLSEVKSEVKVPKEQSSHAPLSEIKQIKVLKEQSPRGLSLGSNGKLLEVKVPKEQSSCAPLSEVKEIKITKLDPPIFTLEEENKKLHEENKILLHNLEIVKSTVKQVREEYKLKCKDYEFIKEQGAILGCEAKKCKCGVGEKALEEIKAMAGIEDVENNINDYEEESESLPSEKTHVSGASESVSKEERKEDKTPKIPASAARSTPDVVNLASRPETESKTINITTSIPLNADTKSERININVEQKVVIKKRRYRPKGYDREREVVYKKQSELERDSNGKLIVQENHIIVKYMDENMRDPEYDRTDYDNHWDGSCGCDVCDKKRLDREKANRWNAKNPKKKRATKKRKTSNKQDYSEEDEE